VGYRGGGSDMLDGSSPEEILASTLPAQLVTNTIGGFPVFAGALALVLGALMFGGEYGWGTIKTLFTQRPGRVSVLAGQVAALAVALASAVAIMFGFGAITSTAIAVGENEATAWPSVLDLLQGFAAGWLILLMWACLGAVLGVVLRGVALPIPPGMVEAPPGVSTSVDGGRALITLTAYVLVCVAVAIWSSRRRDVV